MLQGSANYPINGYLATPDGQYLFFVANDQGSPWLGNPVITTLDGAVVWPTAPLVTITGWNSSEFLQLSDADGTFTIFLNGNPVYVSQASCPAASCQPHFTMTMGYAANLPQMQITDTNGDVLQTFGPSS